MSHQVVGFLSYARDDDNYPPGAIRALGERLQACVHRHGATDFKLWMDVKDIGWGDSWREGLKRGLDASFFLIPVLTPRFFESDWCRDEAQLFLDRIVRGDTRIHPLYVIEDEDYESDRLRKKDTIRSGLREHQHRDLRGWIDRGWDQPVVSNILDDLGREIARRIKRIRREQLALAEAARAIADERFGAAIDMLRGEVDAEADRVEAILGALGRADYLRAASLAQESGPLAGAWAHWAWVFRQRREHADRVAREANAIEADRLRAKEAAEREAERERKSREAAAQQKTLRDAGRKPGTIMHEGPARLRLAWVPSGTFEMGGDESDLLSALPRHPVTLSFPLLVGVTPITQAQWSAVAARSGLSEVRPQFIGADLPMDSVGWLDAVRWCNALSLLEGRPCSYNIPEGWNPEVSMNLTVGGYRLPTEAEWEYCCRAGTKTQYWSGDRDDDMTRVGWCNANIGFAGLMRGARTRPVDTKPFANAFGLLHVHGNISEWCWDWAGPYEVRAVTDPVGPSRGEERIIRGGATVWSAAMSSSCYRMPFNGEGSVATGFRVVLPA